MTVADLAEAHLLPTPFPRLSGGMLALVYNMRQDPLALMVRARRECGDVAEFQMGPHRALVLSHARHVDALLVRGASTWTKDTRGQAVLRYILGQGLLTAQGDTWRRNRRIANPAFARRAIGGFARTMHAAADDTARRWVSQADGRTELDVAVDMNHLALRIAAETLFGHDVGAVQDVIGHGLDVVLGDFLRITTLPWPWLAKVPTPRNRYLWKAIDELDTVVHDIIATRRSALAAGEAPHLDLLGMLMAAEDEDGQRMSDHQLRDEVLTMLLAGHETTANTLAFTLYLLGMHPRAQERVASEAAALPDGTPSREDLDQLTFTTWVLKESLRLFPPAWITSRASRDDTMIDGRPVPAGTFAFLSAYVVHRHPAIWPHPEAFLPDRWEGDGPAAPDGHPLPRNAWIPFGAGQRKCIGAHFAMMEATIALATLLRRVRLTLVPGHPVTPQASLTLRPTHGVRATFTPR